MHSKCTLQLASTSLDTSFYMYFSRDTELQPNYPKNQKEKRNIDFLLLNKQIIYKKKVIYYNAAYIYTHKREHSKCQTKRRNT